MPANYKETLQPEEIKALTDYLVKVAFEVTKGG